MDKFMLFFCRAIYGFIYDSCEKQETKQDPCADWLLVCLTHAKVTFVQMTVHTARVVVGVSARKSLDTAWH